MTRQVKAEAKTSGIPVTTSRGENAAPIVSVVIPAINEEEGIGPTIDAIPREAILRMGYGLEILVIDGNSKDKTREIAESKGARVHIEKRKGYGRAYRTGFQLAKGDVVVTADADTTYPMESIPELLEKLEGENLDFITGNRFGKMLPGAMSTKHKIGNWILSTTGQVLFFVSVKDSQSGMWVFRRKKVLDNVRLTSDGMPMSEEIKIEAFRSKNLRCVEVPIEYRIRVGEVKLASWKDGWRCLKFMLKKRVGLANPDTPW